MWKNGRKRKSPGGGKNVLAQCSPKLVPTLTSLSVSHPGMHELPWYESMLTCSQHSRGPTQLVWWICMWPKIFVHCTISIGIPAETRCSWLHGLTCLIMAVLSPFSDNSYTVSHTSFAWVASAEICGIWAIHQTQSLTPGQKFLPNMALLQEGGRRRGWTLRSYRTRKYKSFGGIF